MISTLSELTQGLPGIAQFCVCCRQRLAGSEEYCAHCSVPTALSQTAASRTGPQSFLSVLGASNAGKTVYLGLLLDILSKGSEAFRGTATGAFSIDLQEQVITALERQAFPQKTPAEADAWKWLHCQISMTEPKRKETRYVDLISPDFAGEAIAMEVAQKGLFPAIAQVVSSSAALLILCDSLRVRDNGSCEDLFAMKLASYIAELHELSSDRPRGRTPAPGPAVAIIFTKCDQCPEASDDPTLFAANNTPRLFEFCKRTFAHHAFFAASVAGNSGVVCADQGRPSRIPLDIEPRGILEPLQWIIGHRWVARKQ